MNQRVRTTISLDPEVHDVFKRMSEATGESVSRCMGDWLRSTADGAELVTERYKSIKRNPLEGVQEWQRDLEKMNQFAEETIDKLKRGVPVSGSAKATPAPAHRANGAPSSNTGLKSPSKGQEKGGKL